MKFRVTKYDVQRAKRRDTLLSARRKIVSVPKGYIRCYVHARGIDLTIGTKCVKIEAKHALRLAKSILKNCKSNSNG